MIINKNNCILIFQKTVMQMVLSQQLKTIRWRCTSRKNCENWEFLLPSNQFK